MKLFMQGMRRSGTTIGFDVLSQDPRLDLWYEPFSQGKEGALGGGSGVQQVDLMEKVRAFRREFCATWRGTAGKGAAAGALDSDLPNVLDLLNYGAPRAPELELEPGLPDYCRDYLKAMAARAEHSVFKFTRLYRKVEALREIEPRARFVQLVRHPREVAASYVYGKDQKHAEQVCSADAFFERANDANPWNSRRFFEAIVERDGLSHLRPASRVPNFQRYLLLWKYTFEHTWRDGRRCFGDAFMLLRHEDLIADPRRAVAALYRHAGLDAPPAVLDWATRNVRNTPKETWPDDPRWRAAYESLGMHEALAAAGYGT